MSETNDVDALVSRLEQRITNLEIALCGMWSLIEELQPPTTQQNVSNMLSEFFDANTELGGCRRANFDIDG